MPSPEDLVVTTAHPNDHAGVNISVRITSGSFRLFKVLTCDSVRKAVLLAAPEMKMWSRSMASAALKDECVSVLSNTANTGDCSKCVETPGTSVCTQKSTIIEPNTTVNIDLARIVKREAEVRRSRAENAIQKVYFEDDDVLVFTVEAGVGEKYLSHSVFPELQGNKVARNYRFMSRSYTAVPGLVVVAKNARAARQLDGGVKMTFRALCVGKIVGQRTIKTLPEQGVDRAVPAQENSKVKSSECKKHQKRKLPWERFRGMPNTTTVSFVGGISSNSHGYVSKLDLSHEGPLARHQIRLHLQQIGHPVIGTAIYTRKLKGVAQGACMVLNRVEFVHPGTGKLMTFEIPEPQYFDRILEREERFADERKAKRAKIIREQTGEALVQDETVHLQSSSSSLSTSSTSFNNSNNPDSLQSWTPQIPLAYQLGVKKFMGRDFKVDERVLIPRASSSLLVETAVQSVVAESKERGCFDRCHVLDLGTGSGCLVVSILLELGQKFGKSICKGIGVDLYEKTLSVAADNVRRHGLQQAVSLRTGSFANLPPSVLDPALKPYDVIVCNPPYHSSSSAYNVLDASVVAYEPHEAMLISEDKDKYVHYREVCETCVRNKLLAPGKKGILLFEAPPNLIDGVKALMAEHGFSDISEFEDGHGLKRAVSGRYFTYNID